MDTAPINFGAFRARGLAAAFNQKIGFTAIPKFGIRQIGSIQDFTPPDLAATLNQIEESFFIPQEITDESPPFYSPVRMFHDFGESLFTTTFLGALGAGLIPKGNLKFPARFYISSHIFCFPLMMRDILFEIVTNEAGLTPMLNKKTHPLTIRYIKMNSSGFTLQALLPTSFEVDLGNFIHEYLKLLPAAKCLASILSKQKPKLSEIKNQAERLARQELESVFEYVISARRGCSMYDLPESIWAATEKSDLPVDFIFEALQACDQTAQIVSRGISRLLGLTQPQTSFGYLGLVDTTQFISDGWVSAAIKKYLEAHHPSQPSAIILSSVSASGA